MITDTDRCTDSSALPRTSKQGCCLKIALVVHDLNEHGGHSLYTKILADALSRNHEVAVFANGCERPAEARWQSHHVRAWRGSALATVQTFPLGLRSYANELADYDIRHSQGYCGGDPNVVTAHICVAAYLNSLRDISARNRASLRLMAAAEERFYRGYGGSVIAVSRKIARELKELYGVSGSISVIPHGVDADRFNIRNRARFRTEVRQELTVEENETLALYVGDLTKSHSYLKELSAAASDIRFVIVTTSQVYHWSAPNVQILPPTAELERYYAAADAFLFPTTYDSFGMVVLEAMASGLPVFCSDQAGAAELIESGQDGFVLPLNEWLGETAIRLRDRAQLKEIGLAAEQSAKRHEWSSVVSSVEKVYSEVMSNR